MASVRGLLGRRQCARDLPDGPPERVVFLNIEISEEAILVQLCSDSGGPEECLAPASLGFNMRTQWWQLIRRSQLKRRFPATSENTLQVDNTTRKMPRYYIVDNDAGIDDAWAILVMLYANSKNELLALTCVSGNTSLENVCRNNLRLLAELNRTEIPVYVGAQSQLIPPENNPNSTISDDLQYFHGRNGFGDVELPARDPLPEAQKESAVCALYRLTKEHPGEVTLVCCGPLTNVALAIRTYPDFVENVKEIFIMGGNYTATGNTTRCAEFNFHTDPEAAYIVLHEMEGKSTLLPWETCMGTKVPFDWRENLGAECGPVVKFLNLIEGPIMARLQKLGYNTYISADQLLAAVISKPELILEVSSLHASVELAGFHTRGQIVIDHLNSNKHNTKVIKRIDIEKYQELLWSLRHL